MKTKIIHNFSQLMFLILGSVALLFIFAPLAGLFLEVSAKEFFKVSTDSETINSIKTTLFAAVAGTLVAAIFAVPLAYFLARKNFKGKAIIQGIVDLPILVPHSAAGIAILGFVARDTMLGSIANSIGISFVGNPAGIAMAMAYVSIPYLINTARDGFLAVPERLEKAAMTLGASHWRTFFSVSVPLAKQNIFTGLIMMFARGMSEFGAVIMVAYYPMTSPVLIYDRFSSFGLENARAVSVIFILTGLSLFIFFRIITRTRIRTLNK